MSFKKRAFTLIEILIVIAIILLMAAAAIPAYQNFGARQEVVLKADEVKALLDRAYAYSQNPQQNQNCARIIFTQNPDGTSMNIQYGQINSTKEDCDLAPTSITDSKDIVDFTGMNVVFGTGSDLGFTYSYYPGNFKINNNLPSTSITIGSNRTTREQRVVVTAEPYSAKNNTIMQ
ncbi:MAG: prepilin-type N-terminal cleavage/methylation domain-containing protein [Patescibacteria group bacterium]|jgi:prepilin-type N-terminal cleavage/methylation domain-containing protein